MDRLPKWLQKVLDETQCLDGALEDQATLRNEIRGLRAELSDLRREVEWDLAHNGEVIKDPRTGRANKDYSALVLEQRLQELEEYKEAMRALEAAEAEETDVSAEVARARARLDALKLVVEVVKDREELLSELVF